MIKLPLFAKLLVPGYRKKWYHKCVAMIDHINEISSKFEYGESDNYPWIKSSADDLRFHGFWTGSGKGEVYDIIRPYLNDSLTRPYFRLMLDYVNRYMYPHMRPDLKPKGYTVDQMFCFHGQQKDAVASQSFLPKIDTIDKAFMTKDDDIIINCGAYLGFGDLRLSKELPNGKIIAVEADQTCFNYLEKNLTSNKVKNVTPVNRAIWNTQTELTLHTSYAQANSLVKEIHDWDGAYVVKTLTIDELVEQQKLNYVSMLSLTLNGAEIEALEGATETITRFKPRIRLAGWYKRDDKLICDLTKAQLEHYGYKVFIGPRNGVCAIS